MVQLDDNTDDGVDGDGTDDGVDGDGTDDDAIYDAMHLKRNTMLMLSTMQLFRKCLGASTLDEICLRMIFVRVQYTQLLSTIVVYAYIVHIILFRIMQVVGIYMYTHDAQFFDARLIRSRCTLVWYTW